MFIKLPETWIDCNSHPDPERCRRIHELAKARNARSALVMNPRITSPGQPARTPQPPKPRCKPSGPGTELRALLASLGLSSKWCIGCQGKAAQMDRWQVAGCRENRDTIRQWMLDAMKSADWWTTTTAAARAIAQGLLVDPLDPAGWLVDEAIRRAEAKQPAECTCNPS